MTLFVLAYLGGVLTIISPCILPVLPFVFARADRPFLRSGLPMLIGMAAMFAAVATLAAVAGGWTQLNRQGPDHGTQYRSAIFPVNADQARIAKGYITQLNQARTFSAAIVTKIEPNREFYPAEDYHQDFLTQHPTYPYIVVNDLPKIEDLKHFFPDLYRQKPVLVTHEGLSN